MTVEQDNVIDFAGTHPETGHFTLCIADPVNWEDTQRHLILLQNKINAYLAFLESGDIYRHYPKAIDQAVTIELRMQFQPNQDARDFFKAITPVIEEAGFHFKWEVLSETS